MIGLVEGRCRECDGSIQCKDEWTHGGRMMLEDHVLFLRSQVIVIVWAITGAQRYLCVLAVLCVLAFTCACGVVLNEVVGPRCGSQGKAASEMRALTVPS
jgi:hypothetical protein